MSLLNVGARALLANQMGLQTAGNNISNVNTPGYSRQTIVQQTVGSQATGSGYIGQGVAIETVLRNHSELLTKQAATAGSVQAGDMVRAERLKQLQEVFSGGETGLGAAINNMMNAFSDVVNAPTDLTARTVVLTRIEETAALMRTSAERIGEIQYTISEQLSNSITQVNALASQMATLNQQIARAQSTGHTPNDLMDERDEVIRSINKLVQTTQVKADDGTLGLFVAGSQALVLGNVSATLSLSESSMAPGNSQVRLLLNRGSASPVELNESMLGGGEISGLLRFNNNDLTEGRNLLGRMAVAISTTLNDQHKLGLTLDGATGKALLGIPTTVTGSTSATGVAVGTISFDDATQYTATEFAASDYEVRFNAAPGGQVVRLSDGKITPFTDIATLASTQIDGLTFDFTTAGNPGERVLFQPFATAAANIQALIYSPRDLAAANPVNAAMGENNNGTLQLSNLKATQAYVGPPTLKPSVTLSFTSGTPTTFTSTTGAPPVTSAPMDYVPGQAINIDGWEITLKGSPNTGDTVTMSDVLDPQFGDYYTRNAGNANALMDLRDVKMFDQSTLSDGYAGAMAQVGTRTQSALFAAELSTTIAANLERDRTSVSGVNLDEEAAKLIQYQQAYQASAKMIQIAQGIFDSLLQGISR